MRDASDFSMTYLNAISSIRINFLNFTCFIHVFRVLLLLDLALYQGSNSVPFSSWKYPLLRGMASYSIIWPMSSFVQQTFENNELGTNKYDWWKCARFGLWGSCYVAPTLYTWLTIANKIWPGNTLKAGIIKTCVETVTYTPFAMCSFYFGMSLLEMKSVDEAIAEVKAKFLPTYKVGATVWPAVAMINFCFIAPRNRVVFISCCSFVWSCFLAYMKHLDKENMGKKREKPVKVLNT